MKRTTLLFISLLLFGALLVSVSTSAQRQPVPATVTSQSPTAGRQSARQLPRTHAEVDLRNVHKRSLTSPVDAETSANLQGPERLAIRTAGRESRLKRQRPSTQMLWSSLSGTPSRVWSFSETLAGPSPDDPTDTARQFLKTNGDLFLLDDSEVDNLRVARRYSTEHNGLTHVTLGQQHRGIEVYQAEYAIHVTRDGSVLAASGELIPELAAAINTVQPTLTAAEALRLAAQEVEEQLTAPLTLRQQPSGAEQRQEFDRSAGFGDHVPARLVYFPLSAKQVRLGWQFIITMRETPDMYYTIIDAERGSLLYLHNLTCYDENPLKPHGQVYTKESPRPNLPRTTANPPTVEREDLPFRAAPYNGKTIFEVSNVHYDWWAGATATGLISNNTNTYLDRDANNQPDAARASAADGNFSFPVDLTQEPTTENNQRAAQVNLFYWINRYHDILYSFGFTESAGNFQTNNFNLGGTGNDAVLGEAQDGSGTNNANFATRPDGQPGRVQMYLWTGTTPQRDGDFDQGVVIHELTHGLSNRLIGNAGGLSGAQDGGMGEGWSDYFGLVLLAQENDPLNGTYPVGQFALNNYTRGIRRFPYSTETSVFPLTFKDIRLSFEVHNVGEIWCNALWEMRAQLIQKYGFQEGQRQSIQLVVDGMKLSPIVPSFLDARNAILLADRANNNGANQCLLWQAFSKRGMGFKAYTTDTTDPTPVEDLGTAPFCSDIGVLSSDKINYVAGETLRISLGDRNATGNVTVRVTTNITGDQENITLTPEPNVPGSYVGTLPLVEGPAAAGNGSLQGRPGDEIAITYNDPNTGNGSPGSVARSAFLTREKPLFEDNVENGNQGWIPSGNWAITSSKSGSSRRSWTDSPAGNYANSSNTSLTSQLFDFTGFNEITLTFAQSYDIEDRFDLGVVEYSTDDGVTWQRAANFTGVQSDFRQAQVNLRALDGVTRARIRFRLISDGGVVGDGWYIDDIRINGRSGNPGIIPPGSTPVPAITNVSPASGLPAGGTRVTISGVSFTENENTTVTFDGLPATNVNVLSGGTIVATTPPHNVGAVTVRVASRNGVAALTSGFTYYQPGGNTTAPTIDTLFPNTGSTRGGTAVTVIGTNFSPETSVTFGGTAGTATFINANTLRVLTPANSATGGVEVAAANGAARATRANGFSYVSTTPPTVQLLSPTGGETLFARSVINISWRSSDNRSVARHRVSLMRNTGSTLTLVSDLATELGGEAQSFSWTIPTNIQATTQARIRVIAIDDEGTETEAVSSNDFTLALRWEPSALLPTALQRQFVASDGQSLYAFGGRATTSSATTVSTTQRLDPAASPLAWTSTNLAPMTTGMNGGDAVFLKGKFYLPGGVTSGVVTTALNQVYDPAANTWESKADVPIGALFYATAVDTPRGVFYHLGGSTNASTVVPTNGARSYNPDTNTWSTLPAMGSSRAGHEAAVIDGKLYVAGGVGATGGLASAEVFDFAAQTWTPIAPLNRPRGFAINFVSQDPAGNPLWFVVGGQDLETGAALGVEVYQVRQNRWVVLDNSFLLTIPRTLMGGAVVGDYFYAVGGATPSTSNRTVERIKMNTITALPLNQAPVLAVPGNTIAVANNEVRFVVQALDLGSSAPITISATGLPNSATFTTETITNNATRGTFRWTPSAADNGQAFNLTFTASDGQLNDVKTVNLRVVTAGAVTAVNAADFKQGPLAADSIAAAFGSNLAVRTEIARDLPLPLELAGTSLTVNGAPAPLFFVSATQINFAVPSSVTPGPATLIVTTPNGIYSLGTVQIAAAAPAIFTANASGTGDAAALATPDGALYQQQPFDVLVNGQPNILLLFGTGFRRAQATNPNDDNGVAESVTATIDGKPATVLYAGAQGSYAGLDQLNIQLPASLAGSGPRRVEVVVTVNNVTANRVTIQIK